MPFLLALLPLISYTAQFSDGTPAFHTVAAEISPTLITFRLEGPAAKDASVTCETRPIGPNAIRLIWHVKYTGPERAFFNWSDGLRFTFPAKPTAARAKAMLRWVKPDGKAKWEDVAGDTPYPISDRQLREISFADRRIVLVTSWYDSDWLYQRSLDRVPFVKLTIPAKAPQERTETIELIAPQPADTDADIIAAALEEPVSASLETGKPANLFAPGDKLRLTASCANVTAQPVAATLAWSLYDYSGARVASGNKPLSLKAGERWTGDLAAGATAKTGIYFLAGSLTWPGGSRELRTTLGVLPQRPAEIRPDSPFGMAGTTCNPDVYPDQPDADTVFALCQRLGVHWVRALGFPVSETVKPDDVAAFRQKLDRFRKYGLLVHPQCASGIPETDEKAQAFRRAFEASLQQYKFLSPYIEVGNELNSGPNAAPFVSRLLTPQFEAMRSAFPEGKVMNAGLGGVGKDWWEAFVKAGGIDKVDAISVHPGHHPRAPEFWEGWDGWVFRSQMGRVFGTLDKLGLRGKREVWVTEAYNPSAPQRSQLDLRTSADYTVREQCLSQALGVRVVEWYQLQDGTWFSTAPNPADNEFSYGMVYTDLAPKPQAIAYGVMTGILEGRRCLGRLRLDAEDLYGIRFATGAERVDVLWSYREKNECDLGWWPVEKFKDDHRLPGEPWVERWKKPVTVSLPAQTAVTVTDIMGNTRTLQPREGKVQLTLTGSPIYVRGLGDVEVQKEVWQPVG